MKKNTMMRIASVLLIAVLMTTCVISGTFAKYANTFTSNDSTATVAKWAFTLGTDPKTALANNFDFNLFAAINDTGNSAAETDVAASKIAPGTAGSLAIKLNNDSEVNATYKVVLTETNTKNVPIEYSLTGEESDWTDDITDLNPQTATAINMGATADIVIYWRWAYNATSDSDTEFGEAAAKVENSVQVIVSAAITVEQVD